MCWPPPPPKGPRGVTVSTLDPESSDRGSNPREAFLWPDAPTDPAHPSASATTDPYPAPPPPAPAPPPTSSFPKSARCCAPRPIQDNFQVTQRLRRQPRHPTSGQITAFASHVRPQLSLPAFVPRIPFPASVPSRPFFSLFSVAPGNHSKQSLQAPSKRGGSNAWVEYLVPIPLETPHTAPMVVRSAVPALRAMGCFCYVAY